MNIVAVSTPNSSGWRWRIVDYAGQVVEESQARFASIALAVAEGTAHLRSRDDLNSANLVRRAPQPPAYGRRQWTAPRSSA
jgi:hypothetical protein